MTGSGGWRICLSPTSFICTGGQTDSEALEDGEGDWLPIAPGSFITFEEDRVYVEPFCPVPLAAVA